MEKYRVKRFEDALELQNWLNQQAQEGYVPILLSGLPGNNEMGSFEILTVIVEHRPAE